MQVEFLLLMDCVHHWTRRFGHTLHRAEPHRWNIIRVPCHRWEQVRSKWTVTELNTSYYQGSIKYVLLHFGLTCYANREPASNIELLLCLTFISVLQGGKGPVIQEHLTDVYTRTGMTAEFECRVSSQPQPSITWYCHLNIINIWSHVFALLDIITFLRFFSAIVFF